MSLYLKDRHLAILGIALLAVIAARLILADTGTTPLNPGHPLSQTWIDTNLNLGSYNLYTLGNVGIGTTGPGQKLSVAGTVESTSGGFKFPDGTTQTSAAAGGIPASAIWIQQNSQSSSACDRPSRQWDPTACGYTVGSNGGYVGTYSAGGGCHRGPRLLVNGAVVSTGEYRVRIPLSAGSTVSVQSECDQGGCSSSSPLQCTLGLWDY